MAAELGLEPRLGDPESQPDRTKGHRGFAKYFGLNRQFYSDSPFVPVPWSRDVDEDLSEDCALPPFAIVTRLVVPRMRVSPRPMAHETFGHVTKGLARFLLVSWSEPLGIADHSLGHFLVGHVMDSWGMDPDGRAEVQPLEVPSRRSHRSPWPRYPNCASSTADQRGPSSRVSLTGRRAPTDGSQRCSRDCSTRMDIRPHHDDIESPPPTACRLASSGPSTMRATTGKALPPPG